MRLPNAEFAVVPIEKLRDYCLCPTHPRGRHKAKVFAARLGIGAGDAELLRLAILQAVKHSDAIAALADSHGQRYMVDFVMMGPSGQANIRTCWIIRTGEDVPRLTSCYVL